MDNMFVPTHYSDIDQQTPSSLQIQLHQATIYRFFKQQIQEQPPAKVLSAFKSLFIDYENNPDRTRPFQAISKLLVANFREGFFDILKRSCYLLINDWIATNQEHYIKQLVDLFSLPKERLNLRYSNVNCLRKWIAHFVQSRDYQNLKVFTYSLKDSESKHWSNYYSYYLLIQQHLNYRNLDEQREAAYKLARKIKGRFKFDLARYLLHLPTPNRKGNKTKNPTNLGDEILRLIPLIIPKRGNRSYQDLANIFLKQVHQSSYRYFKECLQKYLLFSTKNKHIEHIIQHRLAAKISSLSKVEDGDRFNAALLLQSCQQMIDYLTTENGNRPSDLFLILMSCSNPLILAILLLKIVLIAPSSEMHLKLRLAQLLEYYQSHSEIECEWIIAFFEYFQILFAIHAGNLQYSLIPIKQKQRNEKYSENMQQYRVFSQQKSWENFCTILN